MLVLLVILGFMLGFTVGSVFKSVLRRDRSLGDLRVDRSDPTSEPLLLLELDTDVYTIMQKKLVTFRVKVENILPHK